MENTPDPASGGGAGLAQPAPGAVQPNGDQGVGAPAPAQGQQGQGQQGQQQGDGNWWNLFPNVPQEHRQLLEPHLREMQGYTSRLEQQLAPFRPFVEAGISPETAQGLLRFSTDFDRDPRAMWIRMGQMLQQGDRPVIDPDLDLDYLDALSQGQDPDAGIGVPGQQEEGQLQGDPQLLQEIASLKQQVEQLSGGFQQQQVRAQEQAQDRLYRHQLTTISTALKEAGWPDDAMPNEQTLAAYLLTHRGNTQSAVKAMVDQRTALLRGFTAQNQQQRDQQNQRTNMPGGPPPTDPRSPRPKDAWGTARQGATARLRRANSAAAQSQ